MTEQTSFEAFIDRLLKLRARLRSRVQRSVSKHAPTEGAHQLIFESAWLQDFDFGESLRSLLRVCYFTSLHTYEGSGVSFQLVWMHGAIGRQYIAKLEDQKSAIDVGVLRELAQGCSSTNVAICVDHRDHAFFASGLVSTRPAEQEVGFKVTVRGPAQIEYREGSFSASYNKGMTHRRKDVLKYRPVQQALEKMEKAVVGRLPSDLSPHAPRGLISLFFVSLLADVERRAHGGTIIIVPEDSDQLQQFIDVRRKASTDVLFGYYEGRSLTNKLVSEVPDREKAPELIQQFYWYDQFNADEDICQLGRKVGGLADCDGAVVFNTAGHLEGFGSLIKTDLSRATSSDESLHLKGARHNSAAWCCDRIEGAVAIVVSSDGGMTVFYNVGHGFKTRSQLGVCHSQR